LRDFTKAATEPGAIVHTDGLQSYRALVKHGYDHRRRPQQTAAPGEQLLPRAHRAISNLKAWMHGTHRGVSDEHLPVYLDEYAFRHNRRTSPMAAFQTLLGLGALHEPTTYRQIANHDRGSLSQPDTHYSSSMGFGPDLRRSFPAWGRLGRGVRREENVYGTLARSVRRAARLRAGGEGIVDGFVRLTWCTQARRAPLLARSRSWASMPTLPATISAADRGRRPSRRTHA
jgi:transposase-like protein